MDEFETESPTGSSSKASLPADYVGPSGTYEGPGDDRADAGAKADLPADYVGPSGTYSGPVVDFLL